jgi:competence protein ComEA
VRIRGFFEALTAAALICALTPAHACFACQAAPAKTAGPALPSEARVDLNSASLDQLLKVPGMTRTWATRIIRFRPYRAKNDIVDRGVVTSDVYARIKNYIIAHRSN